MISIYKLFPINKLAIKKWRKSKLNRSGQLKSTHLRRIWYYAVLKLAKQPHKFEFKLISGVNGLPLLAQCPKSSYLPKVKISSPLKNNLSVNNPENGTVRVATTRVKNIYTERVWELLGQNFQFSTLVVVVIHNIIISTWYTISAVPSWSGSAVNVWVGWYEVFFMVLCSY